MQLEIISREIITRIRTLNNVELNRARYAKKYFNKRERDADVGKYLEEIKASKEYTFGIFCHIYYIMFS